MSLPKEPGLDGLLAFKHPVLPPKTMHIRSTFAIVIGNTILKPTEIMYSDHIVDERAHRAKAQKTLTYSKGECTSDIRLTDKEWVDANKPAGAQEANTLGQSTVAPSVVGVAATSMSAPNAVFVSGSGGEQKSFPVLKS